MKIYNTLSRKIEDFHSIDDRKVKMYSCGPTVYGYAHIGNFRAFVFADILKRYLRYRGYRVFHVMNITDVDDKTIKNSMKEGKTLHDFTRFYENAFLEDLKSLSIDMPDKMPRATEHVVDMLALVGELTRKKHTYRQNGSVYFRISSFKGYGKLAGLDRQKLRENADGRLVDSDEYEKEDARDFALWKACSPDDGDIHWESPIGKGRPGWHIECSAMSMKYLGEHFDIHTGGIDLCFPHHTNEIAQSEAATGKKFVNYWLHNEHLIVNGQKMAKSAGNYFTLRDLLDKGHLPRMIRYELLSAHYRQKLDFREKDLSEAAANLQRFDELFAKLDAAKGKGNSAFRKLIDEARNGFESAMDNDLNTAGALNALFVFVREINKIVEELSKEEAAQVKAVLLDFDSVLCVLKQEQITVPQDVIDLAEERKQAREKKDWKRSDELRDEIKRKGYMVDDTKQDYIIKKN